ncbi:hypothetical protein GMI70_06910 [Eggerthellaceae bacterium zg-893]|nr:hypothetical protein [Eggerthellaceae bacterium zg-893]
MDIAFAQNWTNLFEINVNPGGAPRWERIGAGITDADPEGNETTSDDAYYDGEGMASSDVTGGQLTISFSGHRKHGDPAQDYVASVAYEYGEARKTDFRWTCPDGDLIEGKVTLANIKTQGGAANDKQSFSFDVRFNGAPEFTQGDAETFPEAITLSDVTVEVGKDAKAAPAVTPEKAAPAYIFGVEDDEIADVSSDGTVTGIKEGTTRLSVKSAVKPTVRAEVDVTVTAPASPAKAAAAKSGSAA